MGRKYMLVGFALTFLAVFLVGHHGAAAQKSEIRKLRATPAIPIWRNPQCVAANSKEIKYFEIAASTLEHIDPHSLDWLAIGAERALSQNLYRRTPGQLGPRVCNPPAIYAVCFNVHKSAHAV
jgi:hypothetical protein